MSSGVGDTATGRAADGELVVEVEGLAFVGARLHNAQEELLALGFGPRRAGGHLLPAAFAAGLADGGRAHLHPDGTDDTQEEEEDERDDPPLHDLEHRIQILRGEQARHSRVSSFTSSRR